MSGGEAGQLPCGVIAAGSRQRKVEVATKKVTINQRYDSMSGGEVGNCM